MTGTPQDPQENFDVDLPRPVPDFGPSAGLHAPFSSAKEQQRAVKIVDIIAWAPGALAKKLIREAVREMRRGARALILEPNRDSPVKVERYAFSMDAKIKELGTEQRMEGSNSPDTNFRPQRVTSNVEHPGMVHIYDGRVANVSFTIGGIVDAWTWNPGAVGQQLDLPTLTPANKASFMGRYTGRVPADMADLVGKEFLFTISFAGPASIVW